VQFLGFLLRLVNKVLQLLVGLLEVIVNNNDVMNAGCLRKLELLLGLRQSILDALFGLSASATQALLQGLN
jgi:hypothetical protein